MEEYICILKNIKTERLSSKDCFIGGLFFFSSRRRHTRYIGDWSSDVCSSDLCRWPVRRTERSARNARRTEVRSPRCCRMRCCPPLSSGSDRGSRLAAPCRVPRPRSEERRVGKECRSRWWEEH